MAGKSLVKIVRRDGHWSLRERDFEDIAKEQWGVISKRPMVYLADPHEAVEKAMWCYLNGMVPLIGEKDPDVAMHAARKYRIDSLITDTESLKKLVPYLEAPSEPLVAITVLGETFDTDALDSFKRYAPVRLVRLTPHA